MFVEQISAPIQDFRKLPLISSSDSGPGCSITAASISPYGDSFETTTPT